MLDDEKPQSNDATGKPDPVYPPLGTPVVYADYVPNLNYAPDLVKFYLMRNDPSVNAVGASQPNIVGQVVMSTNGFIATATFFKRMLAHMVQEGVITQSAVDLWEKEAPVQEPESYD